MARFIRGREPLLNHRTLKQAVLNTGYVPDMEMLADLKREALKELDDYLPEGDISLNFFNAFVRFLAFREGLTLSQRDPTFWNYFYTCVIILLKTKLLSLRWLSQLYFGFLFPFTSPDFYRNGRYDTIEYRAARFKFYQPVLIPVVGIVFAVLGLSLSFLLIYTVVSGLLWTYTFVSQYAYNGNGHELCHCLQFTLLERIRRRMQLPDALFAHIVQSADIERHLRHVTYLPPSRTLLSKIVQEMFGDIEKALYVYRAVLRETEQPATLTAA